MELVTYENVHRKMLEAFPELATAYGNLLQEWTPDQPGQYILFEDLFRRYVDVLLSMPSSEERDKLLHRAFEFAEIMASSKDDDLRNLAFISMFEYSGDWWFARAAPFLGPASQQHIKQFESPNFPNLPEATPDLEREIIDLHGVRDVILKLMEGERIQQSDVPGISAPMCSKNFQSLLEAQENPNGVAFLSFYGTNIPYVICPADQVQCSEQALSQLVQDLANLQPEKENQSERTCVSFICLNPGERVWNMNTDQCKHAHWQGKLWIRADFEKPDLENWIKAVIFAKSGGSTTG